MRIYKPKCPECGSSYVVKNGMAKVVTGRKSRKVQRYRCEDCYRNFQDPREKKRK